MPAESQGEAINNTSRIDAYRVRLTDLLTQHCVLDAMRHLRHSKSSFAGLFEYNENSYTLIEETYGVDVPDYPEQQVHSLLSTIISNQKEDYSVLSDGSLLVGHPVWLYLGSIEDLNTVKIILKGCFVYIWKQGFDDVDLGRTWCKFAADLYSERICAAFGCRTERRNREVLQRELRLGSSQLASVIDDIGAGLCLIDRDMRVVWHNAVVQDMCGGESAEGMLCHTALFGSDEMCENCPVTRTFQTGKSQIQSVSYQQKSGKMRDYCVTTSPVFDINGELTHVLTFSHDVTDTRIAETELRRYKRLTDTSADFMLVCDQWGNVLAANQKVIDGLGYREEELINRMSSDLVWESDIAKGAQIAEEARARGMAMGAVRLKHSDGYPVHTECFITYDSDSLVFEAVFKDITERMVMQEEIQAKAEQLRVQNEKVLATMQERDRFFRNVSHELRTPLTSIIGFTELLLDDQDEPLSERQRTVLERVAGNGHKLLDMVNELLDLSKIEAQRMQVEYSEVHLKEFLPQVVHNMMPLAKDKDLQLSVEVTDSITTIRTDEQKLGQIMVNLVSNAIKFTPKGMVRVFAAKNGKSVYIHVQDTGIGIPADDLEAVFREFHQASGHSVQQKGTGLGLTIARKLAVLLNGSLTVKSTVGMGSTFTLQLPL